MELGLEKSGRAAECNTMEKSESKKFKFSKVLLRNSEFLRFWKNLRNFEKSKQVLQKFSKFCHVWQCFKKFEYFWSSFANILQKLKLFSRIVGTCYVELCSNFSILEAKATCSKARKPSQMRGRGFVFRRGGQGSQGPGRLPSQSSEDGESPGFADRRPGLLPTPMQTGGGSQGTGFFSPGAQAVPSDAQRQGAQRPSFAISPEMPTQDTLSMRGKLLDVAWNVPEYQPKHPVVEIEKLVDVVASTMSELPAPPIWLDDNIVDIQEGTETFTVGEKVRNPPIARVLRDYPQGYRPFDEVQDAIDGKRKHTFVRDEEHYFVPKSYLDGVQNRDLTNQAEIRKMKNQILCTTGVAVQDFERPDCVMVETVSHMKRVIEEMEGVKFLRLTNPRLHQDAALKQQLHVMLDVVTFRTDETIDMTGKDFQDVFHEAPCAESMHDYATRTPGQGKTPYYSTYSVRFLADRYEYQLQRGVYVKHPGTHTHYQPIGQLEPDRGQFIYANPLLREQLYVPHGFGGTEYVRALVITMPQGGSYAFDLLHLYEDFEWDQVSTGAVQTDKIPRFPAEFVTRMLTAVNAQGKKIQVQMLAPSHPDRNVPFPVPRELSNFLKSEFVMVHGSRQWEVNGTKFTALLDSLGLVAVPRDHYLGEEEFISSPAHFPVCLVDKEMEIHPNSYLYSRADQHTADPPTIVEIAAALFGTALPREQQFLRILLLFLGRLVPDEVVSYNNITNRIPEIIRNKTFRPIYFSYCSAVREYQAKLADLYGAVHHDSGTKTAEQLQALAKECLNRRKEVQGFERRILVMVLGELPELPDVDAARALISWTESFQYTSAAMTRNSLAHQKGHHGLVAIHDVLMRVSEKALNAIRDGRDSSFGFSSQMRQQMLELHVFLNGFFYVETPPGGKFTKQEGLIRACGARNNVAFSALFGWAASGFMPTIDTDRPTQLELISWLKNSLGFPWSLVHPLNAEWYDHTWFSNAVENPEEAYAEHLECSEVAAEEMLGVLALFFHRMEKFENKTSIRSTFCFFDYFADVLQYLGPASGAHHLRPLSAANELRHQHVSVFLSRVMEGASVNGIPVIQEDKRPELIRTAYASRLGSVSPCEDWPPYFPGLHWSHRKTTPFEMKTLVDSLDQSFREFWKKYKIPRAVTTWVSEERFLGRDRKLFAPEDCNSFWNDGTLFRLPRTRRMEERCYILSTNEADVSAVAGQQGFNVLKPSDVAAQYIADEERTSRKREAEQVARSSPKMPANTNRYVGMKLKGEPKKPVVTVYGPPPQSSSSTEQNTSQSTATVSQGFQVTPQQPDPAGPSPQGDWIKRAATTESTLFGGPFLAKDLHPALVRWGSEKLKQVFGMIGRGHVDYLFSTNVTASTHYDHKRLRDMQFVESWSMFGPPYYGTFPVESQYRGPFSKLRLLRQDYQNVFPEGEPGDWWLQVAMVDPNLFQICESYILTYVMLLELIDLLRLMSDWKYGTLLPCKNSLTHLKFANPLVVSKAYKVFEKVRAVLCKNGVAESMPDYELQGRATWRHLQNNFGADLESQQIPFLVYDPEVHPEEDPSVGSLRVCDSSVRDCLDHYYVASTPPALLSVAGAGLVDVNVDVARGSGTGTVYRSLTLVADVAPVSVDPNRIRDLEQSVAALKRVPVNTPSQRQAHFTDFNPLAVPQDPLEPFWNIPDPGEIRPSEKVASTSTSLDSATTGLHHTRSEVWIPGAPTATQSASGATGTMDSEAQSTRQSLLEEEYQEEELDYEPSEPEMDTEEKEKVETGKKEKEKEKNGSTSQAGLPDYKQKEKKSAPSPGQKRKERK